MLLMFGVMYPSRYSEHSGTWRHVTYEAACRAQLFGWQQMPTRVAGEMAE